MQMLASLKLANARKNHAASSEEEEKVADTDRGTLYSGRIALEKIKSASFDDRDTAKIEFQNLYHTCKNFILNAKKTQNDGLVDYLSFLLEVLTYI